MLAYAPGKPYRFSLEFKGTGPDAPPTFVVYRNFVTVTPDLTITATIVGLIYNWEYILPFNWVDGDTVRNVAAYTRASDFAEEQAVDETYVVDESTLRVIAGGDPVNVYVNRTIATMTPLYAGEAWNPSFDFPSDMTGGTYEVRVEQNKKRRLTAGNPVISNLGRRLTFSAAGSLTLPIPEGICNVQVVRTDTLWPQVVTHRSIEVRRMI